MNRRKICLPFIMAAALISICGMPARAAEILIPDLNRTGSVSVAMEDAGTGERIGGGTVTLYRVADAVCENDADYLYVPTEAFADSGEELTVLDAELAERLAAYAKENGVEGKEQPVDADGKTVFTDLTPGLFLIVQTEAAEGYYEVAPFLVTVPLEEDGVYRYDVDALPKMEKLQKEPDTERLSTDGPKTGDSTDLTLWCSLLAGSLTVAALAVIAARRRKKSEETANSKKRADRD